MKIKTTVQVYKARDGWRWRARRCGRIVGESGEGYTRRARCLCSVMALIRSFRDGNYKFNTEL